MRAMTSVRSFWYSLLANFAAVGWQRKEGMGWAWSMILGSGVLRMRKRKRVVTGGSVLDDILKGGGGDEGVGGLG